MNKALLLFLFCLSFFCSCRKEVETSWDSDILAPLVKASLNINNILPDSILQANPDSSLKIAYESSIYKLSMDTLFNIPDTNIHNAYNIPFTYTFNPGQVVINNVVSETSYELGTAELRTVIVKTGFVNYTIKSNVHEVTDFIYSIPCAKKNGIPFSISVSVPAAVGSTPGVFNKTYDLSGYTIDLTGIGNNKVNTLYTSLSVSVSPSGSPVSVVPSDSISIDNTFYGLVPAYARGYFGSSTFDIGPEQTNFSLFSRIVSGSIQLEDVNFNLQLENPVGMDARMSISNLSSINSRTGNTVNLSNAVIGSTININRASESGGTVFPTYANFPFTTGNSNIKPMIENLPDKLGYSMKVITNPLGNVSGSNDFIYSDKVLNAKLNIDIPLSLIATNLTLADTFDISFTDRGIKSGTLTLLAENGFPYDAALQIYMLDNNNNLIDSLYTTPNTVESAPINALFRVTSKQLTKLDTYVSEEKMKAFNNAKKLKLKITFNTISQSQLIKIYSDYSIDIKLIGDFKTRIQLK